MSVLVLDSNVDAEIKAKIKFAKANVLEAKNIIEMANKSPQEFKKLMTMYYLVIPFNYQVTYTHERHPVGLLPHISINISKVNLLPSVEADDMQSLWNSK